MRSALLRHPGAFLAATLCTFFASSAGQAAAAPAGAPDARAAAVAERAMTAMGGKDRFARVRLLRFDFAPSREGLALPVLHHWWDRKTADYRLEGVSKEGQPFRILFNLVTEKGQGWVGKRALDGKELADWIQLAKRFFRDQSAWLMIPWSWLDEGNELAYVGAQTIDGEKYEVVDVTFHADLGMSDRFRAYVSSKTGLLERWTPAAPWGNGKASASAAAEGPLWAWGGWKTTPAGIELATTFRRIDGGDDRITLPVADAVSTISDTELRRIFHPRPLVVR